MNYSFLPAKHVTHYKGFSLIECTILVLLLGFLLTLSTSSWVHLRDKNEKRSLIDGINSAIHYSRMQAVIRGYTLFLSPLSKSNNWSSGCMLSEYDPHKKKRQIIQQWQWRHQYWDVQWRGATHDNVIPFAYNPITAMSNGRFILSNHLTNEQVELVLNRIGRIKQLS